MRARLVQIGNSRGIRLPKRFIEEVGLVDEVDLHVVFLIDLHPTGGNGI